MSQNSVSAGNVSLEVAKLFGRLSVDEVVEREAQLRLAAQQKESQLRRLVSERYRELVACGPLLLAMQSASRRVVALVETARAAKRDASATATATASSSSSSSSSSSLSSQDRSRAWKTAQLARELLLVEQTAWRKTADRKWSEAAKLVRTGMRTLEENRSELDRVVPVVMKTALADGRLLAQIREAARQRLAEPTVLTREEKLELSEVCGGGTAELEGRIGALNKALSLLGAEEHQELASALLLAADLLQESASDVPGFLDAALRAASGSPPPRISGIGHASSLLRSLPQGKGAEDAVAAVWERVLLPPVLAATRSAVREQLRTAFLHCHEPEQASAALTRWKGQNYADLHESKDVAKEKDCKWERDLAAVGRECVLAGLAELAERWENEAVRAWRDLPTEREVRALQCALRLQGCARLAASMAGNASANSALSSLSSLSRPARDALLRAQQHQQQMSSEACDTWFFGWAHAAVARLVLPPFLSLTASSLSSSSTSSSSPRQPSSAVVALAFGLCELLLGCPGFPAWLPPLLARLLATRVARELRSVSRFDAQLHLDVLFLDVALSSGRPFAANLPAAQAAAARLGIDMEAISRDDERPLQVLASEMLQQADAIDAAFAKLHSPAIAQQAVARSSSLLQPLLLGSAFLSSMSSSSSSSSSGVFSLPRPHRSAPLRLLPIASRRVTTAHIALPDEEEETATSAPRASSSSLLQRLGSQLWQ